MPIIEKSDYLPFYPLRNGHLNTIYPHLFRKVPEVNYDRKRLDTPDDDFLDIDRMAGGNRRLVLLCHGLEGSSDSQYIKGTAALFFQHGWDVAAMNYRGCSGEMNRQKRLYHSGATDDVLTTIDYLASDYEEITVVGFSLGGNLVLKFAGERSGELNEAIRSVIAVSVPVDLSGSAQRIVQPENYIYEKRFLAKLMDKVRIKHKKYPEAFPLKDLARISSIRDFDEYYTSQIHGFESAEDYYEKSSSRQFLGDISIPTLIINAMDDPLLSESCYPYDEAQSNEHLHLIATKYGGHVGFTLIGKKHYWSEWKTLEFAEKYSETGK